MDTQMDQLHSLHGLIKVKMSFIINLFFVHLFILGGKALVIPIPVLYLGHSCSWLDVVNSLV